MLKLEQGTTLPADAPAQQTGTVVFNPVGQRMRAEVIEVAEGQPAPDRKTNLLRNPKCLRALWDEWLNGQGGNEPVQTFTAAERGRVKVTCNQRKWFWHLMERLVRNGLTAASALAGINGTHHPHGGVTRMLRAICVDEQNGGHNRLHPLGEAPQVGRGQNSGPIEQ